MKFRVYASVVGSKYLGEFEAATKEEAIEMAEAYAFVSLCHQCSSECENPEIDDISAECDEPTP